MKNLFITGVTIESVRHLSNIVIPLGSEKKKHLILTGKNGSGKTSVLRAMADHLSKFSTDALAYGYSEHIQENQRLLKSSADLTEKQLCDTEKNLKFFQEALEDAKHGVDIQFNDSPKRLSEYFGQGEFVLAYYEAERTFRTEVPRHVEKVALQDTYEIRDTPRNVFLKYLLDLKMTEALAAQSGKNEKADQIKRWFQGFQNLLRRLFEDDSLRLEFDEESFEFKIEQLGKESFDFNTLSGGYAAVLDIVVDIMIRMEKRTNRTFCFDMPGIVLVDEIETHLHLELQRKVLDFLTAIFPNIQFIVSTHSPFILNCLDDAVIYDLEKHLLVENGLTNVPYDGVVEGYFGADKLSMQLQEKFERYKALVKKEHLSDDDFDEIVKLELYLDEIPDYLALDISTEYQKLKLNFELREDF